MKSDYLFIEKMEISCRIGTTVEERAFPQILTVSIRINTSLAKAGKSDSLTDTVDYAAMIEEAKTICSKREFVLVEKVAEVIAETALKINTVTAAEVKVGKKVFPGIESVGAYIYREKSRS